MLKIMKNYERLWNEYLEEHLYATTEGLKYRGYDEVSKDHIAVGLCLWNFSRKHIDDRTDRRTFLTPFASGNHSVATMAVAMVECLPDKVWRKLLWKENIDFSSREAFLRRLSNQQFEALVEAYRSLNEAAPKIPRVMKNLWMKIKLLFVNESDVAEQLLSEPYEDYKRSQSKGAWAFNLLGLDFGFSLYPNGENDDRKITNQKWTRFLSIKNHINDFIVNMEFGKYWFFYRTARSNYVIRPNKKIDLRTHICPGFWMTLILHLLFWVVSPALAIIFNVHTITDWDLWRIPFNVLALVTPLWLVAATIKWIFLNVLVNMIGFVFEFYEDLSEETKERINFFGRIIKYIIIGIFVLVVVSVVIALIVLLIKKFYALGVLASPVIGATLYILSILDLLYFVVILGIAFKEENFHWYSDIPKFVRWITLFIPVALALRLFDVFLLSYFVQACVWVWGVLTYEPLLTLTIASMLISFGVATMLVIVSQKNERVFAHLSKVINMVSVAGLLVPVVLIAVYTNSASVTDFFYAFLYEIPAFIPLFFIIGLVIISFLLIESMIINQETIDYRERAKLLVTEYDFLEKRDWKVLLSTKDLLLDQKMDEIFVFSYRWFEDYDIRRKFTLLVLGMKNMPKLEQFGLILKKLPNDKDRFTFMEFVLQGNKTKEALHLLEKSKVIRTQRQKHIDAWKKTWGIILEFFIGLFVYILDGIVWFFRQIGRFFLTLKDVWELFNKRCPYVSRSKYLD
jgi:hypothetical protein